MREIKFRFWNTRNNRWEDDPLVSSQYYQNPFSNSDLVSMQFTGLKDKNGKEIYEGDILSVPFPNEEPLVRTVVYRSGEFSINPGLLSLNNEKSEVIGNVFENPELI